MSAEVSTTVPEAGTPFFWVSFVLDALNSGKSVAERYFTSGSNVVASNTTGSGTGNETVNSGSGSAKSGNGGLIVLGAVVVILLLVVSRIRK